MHPYTSPTTTPSSPPKLNSVPFRALKNFATDRKQLIGPYMRYKKQHPNDDDLSKIKDMDSAELYEPWVNCAFHKIALPDAYARNLATGKIITDSVSVLIHCWKAKIKDWSPHHPDYVPWDEAKKRFDYREVGIGMIFALPLTHFVLGADPGKGYIRFTGSQVQDTCTTPKYYQRANMNSARKWQEWPLAENLMVRRAKSLCPSLVTTDPQQVGTGILWFERYIEGMLAHYITLNNHNRNGAGESTGRSSKKWSERAS
ncbi:hypothetical protein BJ742DRAFT_912149 [Cladochytrium replicatum]|nr:hypothetical protein BJ742DRAFT_912149 [Cladochytrium replicatum]